MDVSVQARPVGVREWKLGSVKFKASSSLSLQLYATLADIDGDIEPFFFLPV